MLVRRFELKEASDELLAVLLEDPASTFGVESAKLSDWLWKAHRILVTPIIHDEFQGIRVTPSVYTMLEELDRFCDAMEKVVRDGLPG